MSTAGPPSAAAAPEAARPTQAHAIPAVPPRAAGDILTLAFGTTTAMWGLGYLCHLPQASLPSPLVFVLMLACMLAGGWLFQRWTAAAPSRALRAGALTGLLNLLVLGSVLGEDLRQAAASALLWVPGSILVSMLCFAAGARLSAAAGRPRVRTRHWPAAFNTVVLAATLLLISVGGVVTGYEAGLAVPDWPNTFGYMMFLYPLSRMTGGIYYEHAHRLMGSLVGLTTVVFAVYLHYAEPRRWPRLLAIAAAVLVIVQGLLGALRVTGRFTLSADPADLAPNLTLAMVHGVLAQVFFTLLAAIRVLLSQTWSCAGPAGAVLRNDSALGIAGVALLLAQLSIGATVRHATWGLHLHITLAVVVLVVVGLFAFRAWTLPAAPLPVHRLGGLLLFATGIQVLLGLAALGANMVVPAGQVPPGWHVLLTTAHQTLGAALLAANLALLLLRIRLTAQTRRATSA